RSQQSTATRRGKAKRGYLERHPSGREDAGDPRNLFDRRRCEIRPFRRGVEMTHGVGVRIDSIISPTKPFLLELVDSRECFLAAPAVHLEEFLGTALQRSKSIQRA